VRSPWLEGVGGARYVAEAAKGVPVVLCTHGAAKVAGRVRTVAWWRPTDHEGRRSGRTDASLLAQIVSPALRHRSVRAIRAAQMAFGPGRPPADLVATAKRRGEKIRTDGRRNPPGAAAARRLGLSSSMTMREAKLIRQAEAACRAPKPRGENRATTSLGGVPAMRVKVAVKGKVGVAGSKSRSAAKGGGASQSRKGGEKGKRRKKKKLPSLVAESLPINLEEERVNFFAKGCNSNPFFRYNDSGHGPTRAIKRYGVPDTTLMPLARRILDATLQEYGSETAYMDQNFGQLLSLEQVGERVHAYLALQGLEQTIAVNYVESAASPTSMNAERMNIRVPCMYRNWRIEGTLSHEIGTHYTRRSNDELQPWHGKRKKWRLRHFLETEEGLATLNNVLHEAAACDEPTTVAGAGGVGGRRRVHQPGEWTGLDWSLEPEGGRPGGSCGLRPYLWQAALHYWSACRAGEVPFVQLYREMATYVDDPDRRWRQCVRVFRGTRDTSSATACMCKDQVYLSGAVDILAHRRDPACDLTLLFAGRLALADVLERGTELRSAGEGTTRGATVLCAERGLRLPSFYARNHAHYMRLLDVIAAVNCVDEWLREQRRELLQQLGHQATAQGHSASPTAAPATAAAAVSAVASAASGTGEAPAPAGAPSALGEDHAAVSSSDSDSEDELDDDELAVDDEEMD
jgi:hypothetical protein